MPRLWKIPLTLVLLAVIFLAPALSLSGGELLSELTRLTPCARWWEAPVRLAVVCGLCWVWLWTEGSALQILLAVLLWFCGSWALALTLGPRRAKTSPL